MIINNPKVVIAGAGGGKTHQMIIEIIKIIPELKKHPEKFCAVVTYTNSATEEIKQRISRITSIPNNLHISTTHSFLTKFIIEPYAHLFKILPIDKNYIDKIILPFKAKNIFIEKAICIKKATELSAEKGFVIYDKILEIAFRIINIDNVCKKVSNRLAYIFVDEYQDMRIYQHNIFQTIVLKGKTNFYCIGDPLQSIFNFTYSQSQLSKEPKTKNFRESPILELKSSDYFDFETLYINNRCSSNLIDFINYYNQIIGYQQMLPKSKTCNKVPVFFIYGENKMDIINKYEQLISKCNVQKEKDKMFSLLIAKDWNTINDIQKINIINNESSSSNNVFNECSRCVLGALGINKTTFLEIIPFKEEREKHIQYRQFCLSILKDIRNPYINVDSIFIERKFINSFKVVIPGDTRKSVDISNGLKKLKVETKTVNNDRFCSSIHTSKGIEATCVLVIAKSNNQLHKWIDYKNIIHDTDDDYRLGYVAFTRAREILCITCLEKPSDKLLEELNKLNIVIF